jgi:predicted methyltransferase
MKRLRPHALPVCFLSLATIGLAPGAVLGQEKSVRPGINQAYENPDVRNFIGVFEGSDRDIFVQRHQIVAACRVQPGMAVADIGAGTGLFTRLFATAVGPTGTVYAVDIAPRFIEHIEYTCKENGLTNVVGVVCPPDSVGLLPGSIDLAFICDTYHHFEFPFRTMASLHRALRSGGRVVVIDFERLEGVSPAWVLDHVRAGRETVIQEIVSTGFGLVAEVVLLRDKYCLVFKKVNSGHAVLDEPSAGQLRFADALVDQAPPPRRPAERLAGGRLGRPLRGTVRAMLGVLSSLRAAGENRFSNDTPARGIPQLMQKRGLASFR